jgi:hypothetical protein
MTINKGVVFVSVLSIQIFLNAASSPVIKTGRVNPRDKPQETSTSCRTD